MSYLFVQLMDATATLNDKTFVLLAVGSVSLGIKSAVHDHLRRLMTQFYHNAAVFHINVGDANS